MVMAAMMIGCGDSQKEEVIFSNTDPDMGYLYDTSVIEPSTSPTDEELELEYIDKKIRQTMEITHSALYKARKGLPCGESGECIGSLVRFDFAFRYHACRYQIPSNMLYKPFGGVESIENSYDGTVSVSCEIPQAGIYTVVYKANIDEIKQSIDQSLLRLYYTNSVIVIKFVIDEEGPIMIYVPESENPNMRYHVEYEVIYVD